jgi:hypothetical protein
MLNKALQDSHQKVVVNAWTIASLAVSMLQNEDRDRRRLHYDFNSV